MDFLTFIIIVIIVSVLAWVATWVLGQLVPGHPAIIDKIIWAVAVFIILMTLARSMGLLGNTPQIPRIG